MGFAHVFDAQTFGCSLIDFPYMDFLELNFWEKVYDAILKGYSGVKRQMLNGCMEADLIFRVRVFFLDCFSFFLF